MRTYAALSLVVHKISYPDLEFLFKPLDSRAGGHYYLQVQSRDGKCNVTGEPIIWRGRKWLISSFATDGEIIQTAFLAVITALEHEARENFKYEGQSILDPHYNPELLLQLRKRPDAIVEREKV